MATLHHVRLNNTPNRIKRSCDIEPKYMKINQMIIDEQAEFQEFALLYTHARFIECSCQLAKKYFGLAGNRRPPSHKNHMFDDNPAQKIVVHFALQLTHYYNGDTFACLIDHGITVMLLYGSYEVTKMNIMNIIIALIKIPFILSRR